MADVVLLSGILGFETSTISVSPAICHCFFNFKNWGDEYLPYANRLPSVSQYLYQAYTMDTYRRPTSILTTYHTAQEVARSA
jgi:hypothetical protein